MKHGKKILVMGLGPAGGIFAAHLAASGYRIYGVDPWQEHVFAMVRKGLKITNFTAIETRLEEVVFHVDQLQEKVFDYVVIAVKTPRTPEVLPVLKSLPGEFKIIVLQNGLDNEAYVAEFFARDRILRMAVNYAGNIESPSVIRMNFFQEPNRVGCICNEKNCGHAVEIAEMMTAAALDTIAAADIREFTWKKAILNAILAPIAAILGVTMADVMADTGARFIVESLIRESIAVAGAAGYDYGHDFFDRCVNFLLKAGKHKPSMLIDLENGNPTEIDYINGKIAEYGRKFNIPVPFNATMAALVKAKENHNLNDHPNFNRREK